MSPAWRRLLAKHRKKTLVELCRRPRIEERVAGFIIDFSESFILLNRLDWNTFTLDGFTLLRDSDLNSKRFFTRDSYWQNRAIKKLKLRPQKLPALPLKSLPDTISAISRHFPLVHIEREIIHSDQCHIGVPLQFTDELLVLDNLDCNGKWSGPQSFKLKDITRVDFGGGYERALAVAAPKRPAKILK